MTTLIDTWRARLDAFPQSWLQLLMRVSIVWIFWRSGMLKAVRAEFGKCLGLKAAVREVATIRKGNLVARDAVRVASIVRRYSFNRYR